MRRASSRRGAVSLVLSAVVILLSPGPACYAAASRSFPGRGSLARLSGPVRGVTRGAFPGVAAVPGALNGLAGSLSVPPLPAGLEHGIVTAPEIPGLSPVTPLEAPLAPGLDQAPLIQAAAGQARASGALEGLRLAPPDFSAMGEGEAKDAAQQDFAKRLGARTKDSARAHVPEASPAGAPSLKGRGSGVDVSDLDELGNPRRGQSPGPDTVSDEFSGAGGRSNSSLFGLAALGLPALGAIVPYGPLILERLEAAILVIPMVVVSLILHEIGHARAALRLGDAGAVLENRGSYKPKDLLTHVDPWWTLILPTALFAFTGLIIGKAREIDYDPAKLSPARTALMAFAGPAVNLALAGLGALALLGLGALGAGASVAAGLALFVLLNVSLAFFNLLPWYPLDGHTIALTVISRISPRAAEGIRAYDALDGRLGWAPWLPLLTFVSVMAVSGLALEAVLGVTALLVGKSAVASLGAGLSILPLAGVLGLMMGSVAGKGPAAAPEGVAAPASEAPEKPVEFLVFFAGQAKPVSKDLHADLIDLKARKGVKEYERALKAMLQEIEAATGGAVSAADLAERGAAPKAVYRRLNAATLRVAAAKAPGLKAFLEGEGRGLVVLENSRAPQAAALGGVEDHLAGAEEMRDILQRRWRSSEREGAAARFLRAFFRLRPPRIRVAVIESGQGAAIAGQIKSLAGPALGKPAVIPTRFQEGLSLDEILKAMTQAAAQGYGLIVAPRLGESRKGDDPVSRLAESLRQDGHAVVLVPGSMPERAVAQAGAIALLSLLFGGSKPGWKLSMIGRTAAQSLSYAAARPDLGRRIDLKAAAKTLGDIMEPVAPGWLGRLLLVLARLIG